MAMSDGFDDSDDESSDDDHTWTQKVKEEHKKLRIEKAVQKRASNQEKMLDKVSKVMANKQKQPQFYELKSGESLGNTKKSKSKKTIEERLIAEPEVEKRKDGLQMVFKETKSKKQIEREKKEKAHKKERLEMRRSASSIKKDRIKPKFWNGKRII